MVQPPETHGQREWPLNLMSFAYGPGARYGNRLLR